MTRAVAWAFAGSFIGGVVLGASMACGPEASDAAAAGTDLSALPAPGSDAGDAAVRTDAAAVALPDAAAADSGTGLAADAIQCMTTCLADDALALKIMNDADACYDACGPVAPGIEEEPPCWQDCDAQIDQACDGAPSSCEHHAVCWQKCFPDLPQP